MISEVKRYEWIDFIKGLLIFLVVFGHSLAGEKANALNIIGVTHYFIYAVHMPLFILISGLLSKKPITLKKAIRNYLLPYLVFDVLYIAWQTLMGNTVSWNILFPTYVYWYILALFFMRLLLSHLNKMWVAFIVLLIPFLSVLVSEHTWTFLAFGRVILLYPLFYLGSIIPLEKVDEFRSKKTNMIFAVASLMICIILEGVLLKTGVVPVTWATHDYSPRVVDYAIKWIYMFGFTLILFSFLAVVYRRRIWFLERWGKNSIVIYLMHPFLVDIVRHLTNRGGVLENATLTFLIMLISSIVITEVLSLEFIKKIYDGIFKRLSAVLRL